MKNVSALALVLALVAPIGGCTGEKSNSGKGLTEEVKEGTAEMKAAASKLMEESAQKAEEYGAKMKAAKETSGEEGAKAVETVKKEYAEWKEGFDKQVDSADEKYDGLKEFFNDQAQKDWSEKMKKAYANAKETTSGWFK